MSTGVTYPRGGGPEVSLRICVGQGSGTARVLGGDLSYGYVRINGEYTT
ncbi:MAG TPA: bifunctional ornithine acetyltransferase/N-acetylglutamate synthase [Actinomycetota bacterium]|nr:bifunctional ornithine acetyltransferase/N-acetylglutamate synthase [Actinomycetota bacterium]